MASYLRGFAINLGPISQAGSHHLQPDCLHRPVGPALEGGVRRPSEEGPQPKGRVGNQVN